VQQSLGVGNREERFDAMMDAIAAGVPTRFRFLDLGTGTGSLTERILRRFPRSRGVALDFDPILLKIARTGLGEVGGRVRWVDADLRRRSWTRALPPGLFDLVVSSTALHWLSGGEVRGLYGALARRLRREGLFLNADGLAYPPSAPTLRRVARSMGRGASRGGFRAWDAWWLAVERDPRFASEVVLRRHRYPHTHLGTATPDLEGHVRRLRAAGFREVEVLWSRGQNRVLAAIR
jgi:SAM-dependent methyltransferase